MPRGRWPLPCKDPKIGDAPQKTRACTIEIEGSYTLATCRKLTACGTSRQYSLLTGWTTRNSIPQASTLHTSFFFWQFGTIVPCERKPLPRIRCRGSSRCLRTLAANSAERLSRFRESDYLVEAPEAWSVISQGPGHEMLDQEAYIEETAQRRKSHTMFVGSCGLQRKIMLIGCEILNLFSALLRQPNHPVRDERCKARSGLQLVYCSFLHLVDVLLAVVDHRITWAFFASPRGLTCGCSVSFGSRRHPIPSTTLACPFVSTKLTTGRSAAYSSISSRFA